MKFIVLDVSGNRNRKLKSFLKREKAIAYANEYADQFGGEIIVRSRPGCEDIYRRHVSRHVSHPRSR